MPEVQEASNIRKNFRKFFLVSKFCGINYFSLPIDRYGKPHIGLGDTVSFIFYFSAYAWLGYYNVAVNMLSVSGVGSITKIQIQYLAPSFILSIFIATIISIFTRENIAEMITDLEKFDYEITRYGCKIPSESKAKCIGHWIYVISLNTLAIVISFEVFIDKLANTYVYMPFFLMIIVQFMASMLMSVYFIRAVNIRYQVLNDLLRELFQIPDLLDTIQIAYKVQSKRGDVIRLAKLHETLFNIVTSINYSFGLQNFMYTARWFMLQIFVVYSLYKVRNKFSDFTLFSTEALTVTITLSYSVSLISLFKLSTAIPKKAKMTVMLINKAMGRSCGASQPFLNDVLRQFLQQTEHLKPEISCGMLVFDWILVFTHADTFFTYLALLLNFEDFSFGAAAQQQT